MVARCCYYCLIFIMTCLSSVHQACLVFLDTQPQCTVFPTSCRLFVVQVSTVEGFVESSVKAFEEDAIEAVFKVMQQQHSSAKVLPIRDITSADGRKREVDGAVIADGCAAILEAKQVLDDTAVPQLASCIEFIR